MGISSNEKTDVLVKTTTIEQIDNYICISFTDFREPFKYECNLNTKKCIKTQGYITGKE